MQPPAFTNLDDHPSQLTQRIDILKQEILRKDSVAKEWKKTLKNIESKIKLLEKENRQLKHAPHSCGVHLIKQTDESLTFGEEQR